MTGKYIGVIAPIVNQYYQQKALDGITEHAYKQGYTPLFFCGGILNQAENVLYDLMAPSLFEGMISLTGTLLNLASHKKRNRFFKRFSPLPTLHLSLNDPNYHCLSVDNYTSMLTMMNHLFAAHNYSRFLYISGPASNQEALLRKQAFIDAMNSKSIPKKDYQILEGDFSKESAIDLLTNLDKSQWKPDIIVCANDEMAIGSLDAMQSFSDPDWQTIPFTGFDNVPDSEAFLPSITTIEQPLYDMGWGAVHQLHALVQGQTKKINKTYAGKLIVRDSCGQHQLPARPFPLKKELEKYKEEVRQLKVNNYLQSTHFFYFSEMINALANVNSYQAAFDIFNSYIIHYGFKEVYLCLFQRPKEKEAVQGVGPDTPMALALNYHHTQEVAFKQGSLRQLLATLPSPPDAPHGYALYPLLFQETYYGYLVCDFATTKHPILNAFIDIIKNTLNRLATYKQITTANQQLKNLSMTDSLTSVLNRRGITAYFNNLIKQCPGTHTIAFVLGDIDRLKQINDFDGHDAGDQAIIQIANGLQSILGDTGQVGRIGGDEFLCILAPSPRKEGVLDFLSQVKETLTRVTISMGVSYWSPLAPKDFQTLVVEADLKMYEEKKKGSSLN